MPFRRWFVTTAAWIAAAVLLAAALLKTSAAFTDAYHFGLSGNDIGQFVATLAIGLGEIVLAISLVRFSHCREVWLIASAVFFCFFAVSLNEGLAGRQSCDCFGTIIVRPYYTAALDLSLALASLLCGYIVRQQTVSVSGRPLLSTALVSLLFFVSAVGLLFVREASSLSRAAGIPSIVGRLQLPSAISGSSALQGDLLIDGRGSSRITIVGMERSCSLKLKTTFPITIDPKQVTRVPFILRPRTDRSIGAVPATMLVDADGVLRKVTMNLRFKRGIF
jgi:hypothetical protein